VVVKEKLVENLKSLRQVLIGKVDGRVRDARSVRSDRVGDVPNTYGVQMLAIERRARLLDKALCVQVVVVPRHEDVDIAHQLQHIQALFERLARKLNLGAA
jgi:hypothetical protein